MDPILLKLNCTLNCIVLFICQDFIVSIVYFSFCDVISVKWFSLEERMRSSPILFSFLKIYSCFIFVYVDLRIRVYQVIVSKNDVTVKHLSYCRTKPIFIHGKCFFLFDFFFLFMSFFFYGLTYFRKDPLTLSFSSS